MAQFAPDWRAKNPSAQLAAVPLETKRLTGPKSMGGNY